MRVLLIQRRPFPGQFSVEGIFDRTAVAMREYSTDVQQVIVPFSSRGIVRRLANTLYARQKQADVRHVTGDIHYIATGLNTRRTVVTVLDCHALERLSGWRRSVLKLFWYDLPLRNLPAITVISAETKQQLLHHMPSIEPDRIHVVPVSVSELYRPTPKEFNAACPRILQIGTKPNKNLPRLIEALTGLSCKLVIVGAISDEVSALVEQAKLDYEIHTGLSDPDLFHQYQRCDLVSFVSTYEGFGMPIVEAQFVERPVVTSNCSSMPEVAGDGACLVDPFCVADIRAGIMRVIGDVEYRNQLVDNGRKNRTRFDTHEIARQYVEIYRSIYQNVATRGYKRQGSLKAEV